MTIHVVLLNQDGVNVICVTSIKFTDDEATFSFPPEFQTSDYHTGLFELPAMKRAAASLTRAGQYRNVKLILKEPIVQEYIDEAENFVFGETVLEEIGSTSSILEEEKADTSSELLDMLRKLTSECTSEEKQREPKLNDIERRFSIERFSGKEKATEWLTSFENECVRHALKSDTLKVKCLKLFLVDNALDWYKSNAIKLKDEPWSTWSASFLKVYADKGWAKVRHAYNYRYLGGPHIDYALKKERLILEVESRTTQYSMINQIVIGLPLPLQDRLDREEIQSTDDLMNKLRQFESDTKKFTRNEQSSGSSEISRPRQYDRNTEKTSEKKPCTICESKGYPGRFHPIERCRNRYKRSDYAKINLNEESESETSESGEKKN